jgi:hypothetical protein
MLAEYSRTRGSKAALSFSDEAKSVNRDLDIRVEKMIGEEPDFDAIRSSLTPEQLKELGEEAGTLLQRAAAVQSMERLEELLGRGEKPAWPEGAEKALSTVGRNVETIQWDKWEESPMEAVQYASAQKAREFEAQLADDPKNAYRRGVTLAADAPYMSTGGKLRVATARALLTADPSDDAGRMAMCFEVQARGRYELGRLAALVDPAMVEQALPALASTVETYFCGGAAEEVTYKLRTQVAREKQAKEFSDQVATEIAATESDGDLSRVMRQANNQSGQYNKTAQGGRFKAIRERAQDKNRVFNTTIPDNDRLQLVYFDLAKYQEAAAKWPAVQRAHRSRVSSYQRATQQWEEKRKEVEDEVTEEFNKRINPRFINTTEVQQMKASEIASRTPSRPQPPQDPLEPVYARAEDRLNRGGYTVIAMASKPDIGPGGGVNPAVGAAGTQPVR